MKRPGIPPEFCRIASEIFRQADASSSRRQGGMGIGLALVKQLTELHDGRVQADSAGIDRGATFTVWIPLYTGGANDLRSKRSRRDCSALRQQVYFGG